MSGEGVEMIVRMIQKKSWVSKAVDENPRKIKVQWRLRIL